MHCCLLSKIISFSSLNISSGSHSEVITFFSSELLEEETSMGTRTGCRQWGGCGQGQQPGQHLVMVQPLPSKAQRHPKPLLGTGGFRSPGSGIRLQAELMLWMPSAF